MKEGIYNIFYKRRHLCQHSLMAVSSYIFINFVNVIAFKPIADDNSLDETGFNTLKSWKDIG